MNIALKIPVCNIIACEDIAVSNDSKVYICNPFTGIPRKTIKKFYTYTVIQGIPNRMICFKIQIINPSGEVVKETEESITMVEENTIRAKTLWSNISFVEYGEYTLQVLIKCNNEFDIVGSSNISVI